jgi:hypothetical protein
VPVWTEGEALPIGVQLIAAPWREDIVLRLAHHLEETGVVRAPVAKVQGKADDGKDRTLGWTQHRQGRTAQPYLGYARFSGGMAIGPTWSHIPNFIGADQAAWHLAQTEEWKRARTVKCNPDPPQIPVRLRALYEGKMLYAPVPYLTKEYPYLRIDPVKLHRKGDFLRIGCDFRKDT